jgi:hypothetical protein
MELPMELVLATTVALVLIFVTMCVLLGKVVRDVAARNLWRMNYTRTWNINSAAKTPPSIQATDGT